MLDYTLHKDIPVPLYYQLKLQLLADIQEGRLHVGDMIPPWRWYKSRRFSPISLARAESS